MDNHLIYIYIINHMDAHIRFDELYNNYDPSLTQINDTNTETELYKFHNTRIDHNIWVKYESYDRFTIYNKETSCTTIYYFNSRHDIDIIASIYSKIYGSTINNDKKRKADDIELKEFFKKIKLDDPMDMTI